MDRHPRPFLPALSLVAALALPASGQAVAVQVDAGHVTGISKGGYVLDSSELCTGNSTGDVSWLNGQNFATTAADDFNLATYFARTNVPDPDWDVDLGLWWDINGSQPDFFVFETGGNDTVVVRALFANGQVGAPVTLSGWTSTGFTVPGGPNQGQGVFVRSFRLTDLRDPAGQPLALSDSISGLRFQNDDIDGAAFCAVDPTPPNGPPMLMRAPIYPVNVARTWQPFTLLVRGPQTSELGSSPVNPFLEVRLQITFTGPSGQVYDVPGFYHARGTQSSEGDIWKVIFTPDEPGAWTFTVSMRTGPAVAVDPNPNAGTPISFIDGYTSPLTVLPRDPSAPGFLKWGRLEYVGGHYLKFRDGPYFIKGGTDSPENLLSFFGFEDGQLGNNGGIVHRYPTHVADWQPGDPLFTSKTTGVDSKGLVGALNYLSSRGVNSAYMMLMNLGGDGQDVFPFVGSSGAFFDNLHYDVGKLEQWNLVFEHAQRKGIMLHLVLNETEPPNETWLDNGTLGVQRKLFYREMVARFSHNLALKWNLCEENDFSPTDLRAFADWIRAMDPYDHPICVHTHLDKLSTYTPLYGDPRFQTSSVQYSLDLAGGYVEQIRSTTAAAGQPWVVDMDENATALTGVSDTNMADMRKRVLWDVYLSGGHVEWYLGYYPLPLGGDLNLEDFRTREAMWDYTTNARTFLEALPFWEMQPSDGLLTGESTNYGGGEVFAKPNDTYAVYLPRASSTGTLNLSGATGTFQQRWYDPRTGQFVGAAKTVQAGGPVALGAPPNSSSEDWAVVLTR